MQTARDIAREAGVSRTTVSYVLSGRAQEMRIAPETSRRVLDVAQELGYQRNGVAQAISSGRSKMFVFLTAIPETEVVTRLKAGVIAGAEERGYGVQLVHFDEGRISSRVIERCLAMRPAALIVGQGGSVIPYSDMEELQTRLGQYEVPLAFLDDLWPVQQGLHLVSDDRHGVALAVEHLVQLGHERIALINGGDDSLLSLMREEGFRTGMGVIGLEVNEAFVTRGWWDDNATRERVEELFSHREARPTALVCAGDLMAMVALRTLRTLGFSVPRDVSVVGYGDLLVARYGDPPLTTIRQPFALLGETIVERLLQSDGSVASPKAPELLRGELVVRDSTAMRHSE